MVRFLIVARSVPAPLQRALVAPKNKKFAPRGIRTRPKKIFFRAQHPAVQTGQDRRNTGFGPNFGSWRGPGGSRGDFWTWVFFAPPGVILALKTPPESKSGLRLACRPRVEKSTDPPLKMVGTGATLAQFHQKGLYVAVCEKIRGRQALSGPLFGPPGSRPGGCPGGHLIGKIGVFRPPDPVKTVFPNLSSAPCSFREPRYDFKRFLNCLCIDYG